MQPKRGKGKKTHRFQSLLSKTMRWVDLDSRLKASDWSTSAGYKMKQGCLRIIEENEGKYNGYIIGKYVSFSPTSADCQDRLSYGQGSQEASKPGNKEEGNMNQAHFGSRAPGES